LILITYVLDITRLQRTRPRTNGAMHKCEQLHGSQWRLESCGSENSM